MADKAISDPLCRSIGNISSPSRFFFPTVIQNFPSNKVGLFDDRWWWKMKKK